MENKKFWTLKSDGTEIHRDLKKENKNFTWGDYSQGLYDANNFIWYEMFQFYGFGSDGCDYERFGCQINEGDVVLDLGGNIGVFAHRAETRGASKVICFEPLTPTFNCLSKNKGPKTIIYKKYYNYDPDIEENADIFFQDVLTSEINWKDIGINSLKYESVTDEQENYTLFKIITYL